MSRTINLPVYVDFSIGEAEPFRFVFGDMPEDTIVQALAHGLKQKIGDQWADKAKMPMDEATGKPVARRVMAVAMMERLVRGEWGASRSGSVADPVEAFVRQEAIRRVRAVIAAGKAKIDGRVVAKVTPDAIKALLPRVLADTAWVESTRALYRPVEIDDFELTA